MLSPFNNQLRVQFKKINEEGTREYLFTEEEFGSYRNDPTIKPKQKVIKIGFVKGTIPK